MLTQKQVEEIRAHLEKAQNPLFFFDNDADGLSSFLLLQRFIGRGKGVAIKSFPSLNPSYARKIDELNPDYVFILDKPSIDEGFFKEVWQKNLPIIWIDHHDVSPPIKPDNYYNPVQVDKKNEPVSYLCYKITGKKEDLWLAMVGCIGDSYLPDFYEEFKKQYPELSGNCKSAFQVLYTTEIGKICQILNFGLKDRTTNVLRMIRFLMKVKSPLEILKESPETKILFKRYSQINTKYQKLLSKAKELVTESKILYFQYGGELSLSSDIANELSYRFPDKIICVAYIRGTKANVSLRGKSDIRKITLEAIKDIPQATGGGHEHATGCQIPIEELPKFKEGLSKLVG